jgi:biopolymer transport protein ExbD
MKKFDNINVVPFIDIMLVVLSIVVVLATFIQNGKIPISLPKATTTQNISSNKSYTISITEDNKIYFNDIVEANIEQRILELPKDTQFIIKSDKNSKFENFVTILDILNKNSYPNISIEVNK